MSTEKEQDEIVSKDNQYIKLACSLHEKKYRKEKNLILFEGQTLIEEAIKRKITIKTLFYSKESVLEDFKQEHPEELDFEILQISQELMEKISTTDSAPPLIAISEKPNFADPMHNDSQLNLLQQESPEKKTGNLFVYCENIQDPGNLGSIIRTSFSAGVEAVYLSHDCADIYNPKTLRSSMGTMFCGPVIYKDLSDIKENLKKFSSKNQTSYEIIGTSSYADTAYDEVNINKMKNLMLMVGNESKGLRDESIKACTMSIKIDLENDIESLNVLSATSIILFNLKNKLR
jgi:RNA methyltransferase, TrmH family